MNLVVRGVVVTLYTYVYAMKNQTYVCIFITLVLVNFSEPSYRADVNATSVIVRVTAFGSFDFVFLVEVVPDAVNIPEGM